MDARNDYPALVIFAEDQNSFLTSVLGMITYSVNIWLMQHKDTR